MSDFLVKSLKNIVSRNKYLRAFGKVYQGKVPFYFEYDVNFKPRWCGGRGHQRLDLLIQKEVNQYKKNLIDFKNLASGIASIDPDIFGLDIEFQNPFIPFFDALTIMWAATKTKNIYLEIGSGNSTKFAKLALLQKQQRASLISIDPNPRAEIDKICDKIIRQPLEEVDLSIFKTLKCGDTIFVDNSHQSFMNTDVTTFMLDVLPILQKGVNVGFHDIFLPFDYFASWAGRGYNEQYLLACYLLSNPNYFTIQIPSFWLFKRGLHELAFKSLGQDYDQKLKDRMPSSFWLMKN